MYSILIIPYIIICYLSNFVKCNATYPYKADAGMHIKQKNRSRFVNLLLSVWQRNRDSNPNKQSQSLSCYRYTIPLKNVPYYTHSYIVCQHFLRNFFKIILSLVSLFSFQELRQQPELKYLQRVCR